MKNQLPPKKSPSESRIHMRGTVTGESALASSGCAVAGVVQRTKNARAARRFETRDHVTRQPNAAWFGN
jgi:hypothetical protein